MDSRTREKLREWVDKLDKLSEEQKNRESEAWCLGALDILEKDRDFQEFCGREVKG